MLNVLYRSEQKNTVRRAQYGTFSIADISICHDRVRH